MNFILTDDADVAKQLRQNGFICLGEENGIFRFVNCGKMNFSEDISKKITYTNIINV